MLRGSTDLRQFRVLSILAFRFRSRKVLEETRRVQREESDSSFTGAACAGLLPDRLGKGSTVVSSMPVLELFFGGCPTACFADVRRFSSVCVDVEDFCRLPSDVA